MTIKKNNARMCSSYFPVYRSKRKRSPGKVNKKTLDICTRDREKFKLMFNEISHCLFPDTLKT